MNQSLRSAFWPLLGGLAALAAPVRGQNPVSVTEGEPVATPYVDAGHFTCEPRTEAVAVPVSGWKVVWPMPPKEGEKAQSGIRIVETNDLVRGVETPVLRLELTHGDFPSGNQPLVELARPFNAETHNVLSFIAKVEVPPALRRVIGDSSEIYTGWFSTAFNRYFDDFGIAVDDGHYQWSAEGVPTTMFRFHDFPATRGADGYADFTWDMRDDNFTGNKGFVRDRAKALRLHYDTRKIPEGEKVVVSVADIRLVKGVHARVDDSVRYAAWTNFVANYTPDYSDSSAYLKPPREGRLAKPIRLTEEGQAKCEIVVDFSDAILIDKFFPDRSKWRIFLREARGKERFQTRFAANELQRWLREITGAEIPVLLAPSGEKRARLYLGASFAKPHFPEDLAFLASGGTHDGYAVREKDGDLYLFGASPAGTLNAVYAFLENNTDIIWAFRDEKTGTVYTPTPTLDAVWGDAASKPAMAWRGVIAGDWAIRNYMNVYHPAGWSRAGGHYLCPQYYASCEGLHRFNPVVDRFDPKRSDHWTEWSQLACLSDPEFRRRAAEYVPNVRLLRYEGREHMVFGPDDNYNVCECPLCSAPITNKWGAALTPEADYFGHYNAWFYAYLDQLDAQIQKYNPGFITSTFAYFMGAPYPQIPISKNIQPQLCTYVRKSQVEPLFAPVNQHWWRMYRDWAAHGRDMIDYDYWALSIHLYPKAESLKFETQAKRDIGCLSAYSEGSCEGEHVGAGNARWCIARLLWDPDQDVEQLHRRFNRRTYREAAPWVDRFDGTIREAFLKHAHRTIDFESNREGAILIRDLGLEGELRGYLAKARSAVRHPKAKPLVEMLAADFDHYMTAERNDYPSKKMAATDKPPAPAPRKLVDGSADLIALARGAVGAEGLAGLSRLFDDKLAERAADPAESFLVYSSLLPVLVDGGFTDAALRRLDDLFLDRRLGGSPELCVQLAAKILPSIVAKASLPPARALALLRRYDGDDRGKALGLVLLPANRHLAHYWNSLVARLASDYARKGDFAAASDLYGRWARIDGATTPADFVSARLGAGVAALRKDIQRLEGDVVRHGRAAKAKPADPVPDRALAVAESDLRRARGQLATDLERWYAALSETAREGSTESVRRKAESALLLEHWDETPQERRIAAIDGWVAEKFLPDLDRRNAADLVKRLYVTPASTNLTALAEHALRCIGAGDWSDNSYRLNRGDLRLAYALDIADFLAKHGAPDKGCDFLLRAVDILGYGKDAPAPTSARRRCEATKKLLEKLDAALTARGLSR